MFVIRAVEDGYEIVGYTSLRPAPGYNYLQKVVDGGPQILRAPRAWDDPVQATVHNFELITRHGERRLLLREDQDPTILDGWAALRELPGQPIEVYAYDIIGGYLFPLIRVAPGAFLHMRRRSDQRVLGAPRYWTWTDHLEVLPAPDELWRIETDPALGFGEIPVARDLRLLPEDELRAAYDEAKAHISPIDISREGVEVALAALHQRARYNIRVRQAQAFYDLGTTVDITNMQVNLPEIDDAVAANLLNRTREQIDRAAFDMMAFGTGYLQTTAEGTRRLSADEIIRNAYNNIPEAAPPLTLETLTRAMEQLRATMGPLAPGTVVRNLNHVLFGLGTAITREAIDDNLYRTFPGLVFPEPISQAARDRARGLLRRLVSPEQWECFTRNGYIVETVRGVAYTLRPGGMIEVGSEKWCVAPTGDIPPEDKLIGQLLHLRNSPEELRHKANVFGGGLLGRRADFAIIDDPLIQRAIRALW